jgi:hypothetical protein
METVRDWLHERCKNDFSFIRGSFRAHRYLPGQIRESFRELPYLRTEFSRDLVAAEANLEPGEELSLQSRVETTRGIAHIPMTDFSTTAIDEALPTIHHALDRIGLSEAALFNSGRSFHLYGTVPVSWQDWVLFNARLLAAKPVSDGPIIDSRWFGHRLYGGVGALRLTNRTGSYLQIPEFYSHIKL